VHVELLVPGLIPRQDPFDLLPRMPALELLMARGRATRDEPCPLERWLGRAFGLQETAVPAGALTALAHGLEPGEACWLRADPVHFQTRHSHLAFLRAGELELSREEADALAESIGRHFGEAFALRAVEPKRWCLRAAAPVALQAEPPVELSGRDVDSNLPRGPDAARWHAVLNELQMLLHDHPVNDAREQRGAPAINSLWLWGAGTLPREARAPWQSIAANDPVALGFARLSGARHAPDAHEWRATAASEGRHLVVLDVLRATPHSDRYRELEERWFAPLLAALRAERIGMVTLHVPDAGISFETVRGDLRRFWRRAQPLASYAA